MAAFDQFLIGAPQLRATACGRTEIAGNHVDHQGGMVIAATIAQGISATACKNVLDQVRVESAGFESFALDAACLRAAEPDPRAFGTPAALVTGMIRELSRAAGIPVEGFDLRLESTVPVGGGLSSSAAFELVVGAVANALFFDNRFDAMTLARIAQKAETDWFGKPCGLMDQAVIATGGVVAIDFGPDEPRVEPLPFDFDEAGLAVVLVDVHADHAHATPAYAAIPAEMTQAARLCGHNRLADVPESTLMNNLGLIRQEAGDRAALRALHFARETKLTCVRAEALRTGDIAAFCEASALSAASSAQYLQNVSDGGDNQPAMIALALADLVLGQIAEEHGTGIAPWPRGVARIHGGGFGGSIQVFLPTNRADEFCARMDSLMGAKSCNRLSFTQTGAQATWI